MDMFIKLGTHTVNGLDALGAFIGVLPLRLILSYEFWKAGMEKYNGSNWFAHIKDNFPFPFNMVPAEVSWQLATWTELLGAVALLIGLGTRLFGISLTILTVVAILSAHMPAPEAWSSLKELWDIAYHHNPMRNGNYGFEIPLYFLIMLIPLVFLGPGKLSLDYWISRRFMKKKPNNSV